MPKLILAATILVILGTAAVITIGSIRWNQSTAGLVKQLLPERSVAAADAFTLQELEGLPDPVAEYFRSVLREGQPLIRSVRLAQSGEFRLGESEEGWKPFEATQHFSTAPRGFVWDAGIHVAPFMTVRVRDGYVAGEGSMRAALFSVITVLDERPRAELNSGALQRYLAEAAWFPTALLPSQGVQWTAIDDSTGLATLTDSGITVSLHFYFNDDGEIAGIFTPERYREVDGVYELTPWAGRFRNYEMRHGVRIPLEGEVEWILPGGSTPYWRGRLIDIEYSPAP